MRPPVQAQVLLIIADISGYTRFMIANQTELTHSHEIVGALLESIIAEVEIPLSIAKLEGDAVFLYLVTDGSGGEKLQQVRTKLLRLFDAFSSRLRELATTHTCSCGACRNIEQLRLKVIIHSGTALIYGIAGGTELAGVDVIVLHRLLKNSVTAHEYILLTDAAKRDIPLDLPVIASGVEEYEDIGRINVTVYGVK